MAQASSTGTPTINDVARIAGVSKKTVSRVINRSPQLTAATRAKVEAAIAELDFVPNPQARALAFGHGFLIALVHRAGEGAVAVPGLIATAEAALAGSPYALVLREIAGDGAELRALLAQHRPRAVILAPPLDRDAALLALCRQAGSAPVEPCDTLVDEREAVRAAVSQLANAGQTRIGFIGGPEGDARAQARELGYLDAMADHGLDRGAALIAPGDWSVASGQEAARLLLEVSPRPGAIITANEAMAIGALHAAAELDIPVPQALSILACGASPWPPVSPIPMPLAPALHQALQQLVSPGQAAG